MKAVSEDTVLTKSSAIALWNTIFIASVVSIEKYDQHSMASRYTSSIDL